MAITFVGSAKQEVTSTGVDITLPTVLEDDLVIVMGCEDTSTAPTAPNTSGYTPIFAPSVDTNAPACGIYGKFMGATPDTVVNVDDFGGGSSSTAYLVFVFRGVSTGLSFDALPTTANAATGEPNPPSITTSTAGAIVLAVGFLDDDAITTCGLTGYSDVDFQAASSVALSSVMAGWKEISSPGSEDPPTFATDGNDAWHAVSIAWRPFVAGSVDLNAAPPFDYTAGDLEITRFATVDLNGATLNYSAGNLAVGIPVDLNGAAFDYSAGSMNFGLGIALQNTTFNLTAGEVVLTIQHFLWTEDDALATTWVEDGVGSISWSEDAPLSTSWTEELPE